MKAEETICTECGIATIISYSGWQRVDDKEWIIKEAEHLCPKCADKRKVNMFNSPSVKMRNKEINLEKFNNFLKDNY